jgi:arylsulfatase A-like enzyme
MGKQNGYEHSIRVPLIFAGSGIPQNEKRDSYVYLMDIFPTLCDLIGIEIPDSVEGLSLVPSINNENTQVRETLYFAYADLLRGIKDKRYKLIEYRNRDMNTKQLFDLKTDPLEINNLLGKPEYSKTVEKLTKDLLCYRDSWDDISHPAGKKFWYQ